MNGPALPGAAAATTPRAGRGAPTGGDVVREAQVRGGRLDSLDALRFAAAFSVLLYHFVSSYAPKLNAPSSEVVSMLSAVTRYGYLGVNLFFMISGFVILWSAAGHSAASFAIGRFSRLFPTFWVSLVATSLALLAWGSSPQKAVVTWRNLAANATMLPTFLGSPRIDDVYWTLELELQFYFLVFVILFCRQLPKLETWITLWLLLMAAQAVAGGGRIIALIALAPFGPYFAAGCLFYLVYSNGPTLRRTVTLAVAAVLCVHQAYTGRQSFITPDVLSGFVVPVAIVAFFFVFWLAVSQAARRRSVSSRFAGLGAITYPLYLTHATAGALLLPSFPDGVSVEARLLATTAAALAVATIISSAVDKPAPAFVARHLKAVAARLGLLGTDISAASGRGRVVGRL